MSSEPAGARSVEDALRAGLELYAARRFWDAHEAWEEPWLRLRGEDAGEVLRALIQLAAACVHLEAGREAGFRSLSRAAAARITRLTARGVREALGFDLGRLSRELEAFADARPPALETRPALRRDTA